MVVNPFAFAGAGSRVHVEDVNVFDADAAGPVRSTLRMKSNGQARGITLAGATDDLLFTWLLSGVGADYDVMLVTVTGTLDSGNADTWISLGSDVDFYDERATSGAETFTGTLKIRDAVTLVELVVGNAGGVDLSVDIS